MHRLIILLALAAIAFASPSSAGPFTIAFGSCLRQEEAQPVWRSLLALAPDALVLGGDNVYTDNGSYARRPEPARIGTAYAELAANPDWSALRARIPVYATWDDHDYGRNDGGADYPWKTESKAFFMDFFKVPLDSPLRSREGIHDAHWLQHQGHRIQLILLDTRSFRSPLVPARPSLACPRVRWGPNEAPDATMLGATQWRWLEERLAEPADMHVLVSSIQVIPEEHCYEKWANFPRERERLLALLARTRAPSVILSGDRHLGEISRIALPGHTQPLLELTSSGLNSGGAGAGESNRYRALATNVSVDNFATLAADWPGKALRLRLALHGADGLVLQQLEAVYPADR